MLLIRILCLLCALHLLLVGSIFALSPAYMDSIALQPETVYFNKGNAYYEQKEYEKALDAYDQVIRINRNITEAWFNKGRTLYQLSDYPDALYAFEQALDRRLDYAKAWVWKGQTLYKLERYNESIVAFDMAIALDPEYANAFYNKGLVLKELGNEKDAEAFFAKAKELGYSGGPQV